MRSKPFTGDLYATFGERNIGILEARMSGKTLEQIAAMFDITRERVRQVLAKQVRICKSIPKIQAENTKLRKEVIGLKGDLARAGVHTLAGINADTPIKDIGFSVRLWNCIIEAGHEDMTIGEASRLHDEYWLSLPNFGRKCLNELKDAIHHASSSMRR